MLGLVTLATLDTFIHRLNCNLAPTKQVYYIHLASFCAYMAQQRDFSHIEENLV